MHWIQCMWTYSMMAFYKAWGCDHPDMDLPITLFLWPLFRVCSLELKFGVSKGQSKMWQSFQLPYQRPKDLQHCVSNQWNVIKLDIKSNPVMLSLLCFFCACCPYSSRQLKHIAHGLCIYRPESRHLTVTRQKKGLLLAELCRLEKKRRYWPRNTD